MPIVPECAQAIDLDRSVREYICEVDGLGEEAISSYLLWQWKKMNSRMHVFSCRAFSRWVENRRTGADFELWILGTTFALPMLFQAKKFIEKEADGYRAKLRYPGNKDGQYKKLRKYAKEFGLNPFYLVYTLSYWRSLSRYAESQQCYSCGTKGSGIACSEIDSSLCVLHAEDIGSIAGISGRGTKSYGQLKLSDILVNSFPLHSIFCCGGQVLNILNGDPRLAPKKSGGSTASSGSRGLNYKPISGLPPHVVSLLSVTNGAEQWADDNKRFIDTDLFERVKSKRICILDVSGGEARYLAQGNHSDLSLPSIFVPSNSE
jgi:hypothetical protein